VTMLVSVWLQTTCLRYNRCVLVMRGLIDFGNWYEHLALEAWGFDSLDPTDMI
jgi:hypothetical protein